MANATLLDISERFDGEYGEIGVSNFVQYLEKYKVVKGISDEQAFDELPYLLQKNALLWWRINYNSIGDWSQAMQQLIEEFSRQRPIHEIYGLIFEYQLSPPYKNASKYIDQREQLFAELPEPKPNKSQQLDMVYGFLPAKLKAKIQRSEIETFDDLKCKLLLLEQPTYRHCCPCANMITMPKTIDSPSIAQQQLSNGKFSAYSSNNATHKKIASTQTLLNKIQQIDTQSRQQQFQNMDDADDVEPTIACCSLNCVSCSRNVNKLASFKRNHVKPMCVDIECQCDEDVSYKEQLSDFPLDNAKPTTCVCQNKCELCREMSRNVASSTESDCSLDCPSELDKMNDCEYCRQMTLEKQQLQQQTDETLSAHSSSESINTQSGVTYVCSKNCAASRISSKRPCDYSINKIIEVEPTDFANAMEQPTAKKGQAVTDCKNDIASSVTSKAPADVLEERVNNISFVTSSAAAVAATDANTQVSVDATVAATAKRRNNLNTKIF